MRKKITLISVGVVLLIWSIFVINLYKKQEHILFQSVSLDHSFQFNSKYDLEELYFDAKDGGKIHALLYKIERPKGIVIYFHGRGGNLNDWMECSHDFLKRQYNVVAMDYRSFGKSIGLLNERNLLQDAEMVYKYAKKLFHPKHIILYGRSLGTGIATYIASKYPSKMLLLEAPYFSILHQARKSFPYVPSLLLNLMVKYPLRTDLWIQNVKAPIELFHGTSDELISHDSSVKLFDLLKNRKKVKLNSITNGTHNNLADSKEYQSRLDVLLGN